MPLKRLRFRYEPLAGESVLGALASACHEQRLRTIAAALEGAGVTIRRPGLLQIAPADVLERIAVIMRTTPERLQDIAFVKAQEPRKVILGELILPRTTFDFERRRIGPSSLAQSPHHRAAWLNLLLPYCPESLELLVDTCPTCGPLGWRQTRGIANCEQCGLVVPPSEEPGLATEHAEAYRHFADLVARDRRAGDDAVKMLPAELHGFSRTALAGVAIRAGMICSAIEGKRGLDRLLFKKPAAMIAQVVSTGMQMLAGWPGSILTMVEGREAEMSNDIPAYQALRADIRWIASAGPDLVALAFPSLGKGIVDAFAQNERYYSTSQTSTQLCISSRELASLRAVGALRYEKLPSKQRVRARYNADDVDALRRVQRSSIPPSTAASRFNLPVYAMSHLAVIPLVRAQLDRGIVALRGPQVLGASIDALEDRIRAAARPGPPPEHFVQLRTMMAQYPGEKPWAAAVDAMLHGTLPFHLTEGQLSVRTALVEPRSFPTLPLPASTDPLDITHVSLRDAQEILGLGFEETVAALTGARIPIVRHGVDKGVERKALRELASQIASTVEAGAKTGIASRVLFHKLKRQNVRQIYGAWPRRELVEMGLVTAYGR